MSINNGVLTKGFVINAFWWKLTERIFSQGINLLVQVALARLLLPEDFGSLVLMVALINYANIFVQSGLGTTIIQKKEIDKKDISTLLTASLLIAFVMYSFVFFSAPYIGNYYKNTNIILPLRVLGLMLFFYSYNTIQTAVLARNMDFKSLCLRSVVAIPISGGIGIIMAYLDYGLWALITQTLLNIIITVLFMSLNPDLRFRLYFSLERAKKLYSFSVKILLTSIVTGFHDTLRSMMIAKRYSRNDLAYFDKSVTYSGYISQIVTQTLSSVLLPAFSRQQDSMNILRNTARKTIGLITFVMVPVLCIVALFSHELVELVLTEKWLPCAPFLVVYCILRLPGCLIIIDKQVFYAIGRAEVILYYEIGLLFLNLLVLSYTISISPYYVAIGAMIVEILGAMTICFISSQIYGYKLKDRCMDLYKPFLYVAFLVPIWFIKITELELIDLLGRIIICFCIYISLAFFAKDANLFYIYSILKTKRR